MILLIKILSFTAPERVHRGDDNGRIFAIGRDKVLFGNGYRGLALLPFADMRPFKMT